MIRKQKIMQSLRTVLAEERHEKEMAEQRDKLTQNRSLWDQLAEAEKRE